jgi:hypothetical protein
MKKLLYTFLVTLIIATSVSSSFAADNTKTPVKELTTEQKAEIQQIQRRVEEIKATDKSQLSREERRALKKELKEMRSRAAAIGGGGVYLSVGAIIIIILLLILIL